jgi:hypothetical protein
MEVLALAWLLARYERMLLIPGSNSVDGADLAALDTV